jgi:16S rRNA G966 N2-methylase RsmD
MACCSACGSDPAAEKQFGPAAARRDLDRYRRKGPDASSRLFLGSVVQSLRDGDSLLDVGAGVGVVSIELLSRGARHATLVDVSPAYLQAADAEAQQRGLEGRVRCIGGDFVHLGAELDRADVVAMHRVVCCYPDWAALLDRATALSRHLLAFSYPRDAWYVRLFMRLDNLRRRIFGNAFRTFLHPPNSMEAHVVSAGFQRVDRTRTPVWCVDVYIRRDGA